MKTKKWLLAVLVVGLSFFAASGSEAAVGNVVQPAAAVTGEFIDFRGSYYQTDFSWTFGNAVYVRDLYISKGGVTRFNGTILNTSLDGNGQDVPLTVGDDLDVHGYITRKWGPIKLAKETRTWGDANPGEDLKYSLGQPNLRWKGVYGGDFVGDSLTVTGAITGDTLNITGSLDADTLDGLDSTDFLTSFSGFIETDPLHTAWLALNPNIDLDSTDDFTPTSLLVDYGFTDNSANWNTAYSWGNHASAGYLTVETVFIICG